MSFSIKNEEKLPNKASFYFNESNWWVQDKSKKNALAVYDFLKEKYFEARLNNKKPQGFSPNRISKAIKLDPHQVTYALWLFGMLKTQPYKFETDITPGGKPRNNVYLVNLFGKDKKNLQKLLEDQKNKPSLKNKKIAHLSEPKKVSASAHVCRDEKKGKK